MTIRAAVLASIVLLGLAPDARAWGDDGHKIIASIAYRRLTPEARKKVDAILATDKDPLTATDFISRATWADRYRDSDRNSTMTRYDATRNWHFVDIEIESPDIDAACNHHPPLPAGVAASAGPAKDCVVDKIKQFAAELGAPATTATEKALALKYLIHFVGDVHQPLHAADHHDGGGNDVGVVYGPIGTTAKLHGYWDKVLVARLGSNVAAVASALDASVTAAQKAAWTAAPPEAWAQESFHQAKTVVYNFSGERKVRDDHGGLDVRLDAAYDKRALPVIKEQMAKAGVRLAHVIGVALTAP